MVETPTKLWITTSKHHICIEAAAVNATLLPGGVEIPDGEKECDRRNDPQGWSEDLASPEVKGEFKCCKESKADYQGDCFDDE